MPPFRKFRKWISEKWQTLKGKVIEICGSCLFPRDGKPLNVDLSYSVDEVLDDQSPRLTQGDSVTPGVPTVASHDTDTGLAMVGDQGSIAIAENPPTEPVPVSEGGVVDASTSWDPNNNGSVAEPVAENTPVAHPLVDDFSLIKMIGNGSYGKVFAVEHKKTGSIYAMKTIGKRSVQTTKEIDMVYNERSTFQLAADNAFLVSLHWAFQTPTHLCFVMDFMPGGDLMNICARYGGRLPEEYVRFYTAEIVLALNFLHANGIIYRDLKLENVLVDREGHARLTDYGLVQTGIRAGSTTFTFCGTPFYVAPEMIRREPYDFSVDWWALGVLIFELLAGYCPFDLAHDFDMLSENGLSVLTEVIIESGYEIPESFSVEAMLIVDDLLQQNPYDRLGCRQENVDKDFDDIRNHPFFRGINWRRMTEKRIIPPFVPQMVSERDSKRLFYNFSNEPLDDLLHSDDEFGIEFEGFDYTAPQM